MEIATKEILKDWESHIALWLMEDPNFFNNNFNAIAENIKKADPDHPMLIDTSQCPIYLLVTLTADKTNNPQILERLAKHPSYGTRMAVAQNYATPAHVLERLSMDERSSVRQNVASNPNTPPEVLEKLSSSDCIQMLQCVLTNPSTPAHVLESFSKYDKEDYKYKGFCKYYVAQNPSTPPHVLEQLASDDGYLVRGAAASNPSTPSRQSKNCYTTIFLMFKKEQKEHSKSALTTNRIPDKHRATPQENKHEQRTRTYPRIPPRKLGGVCSVSTKALPAPFFIQQSTLEQGS